MTVLRTHGVMSYGSGVLMIGVLAAACGEAPESKAGGDIELGLPADSTCGEVVEVDLFGPDAELLAEIDGVERGCTIEVARDVGVGLIERMGLELACPAGGRLLVVASTKGDRWVVSAGGTDPLNREC